MNNELADALQETEPYYSTDYKLVDQVATMLRQQQDEIEALKKQLEDAKDEMAEWKMSYENCHRMCNGYGMN